jgi:hypothetical protein
MALSHNGGKTQATANILTIFPSFHLYDSDRFWLIVEVFEVLDRFVASQPGFLQLDVGCSVYDGMIPCGRYQRFMPIQSDSIVLSLTSFQLGVEGSRAFGATLPKTALQYVLCLSLDELL